MSGENMLQADLKLSEGCIAVWTVDTEKPALELSPFEQLLTTDELDRADRFRFKHLRRNYVLSRALLRVLCSRYLGTPAADLNIQYGTNGKPHLGPDCKLGFNLSHSGGMTVFAFAWGLEIGVDVERIRDIPDIEAIVERFFCPEEAQEVLATPEAERARFFHTCWTRKEAFIKATGDGLSTALDSFQVNLRPGRPECLAHVNFDEEEGRRWTMQDLNLTNPYVGAVCYRAAPRSVHLFALAPETASIL